MRFYLIWGLIALGLVALAGIANAGQSVSTTYAGSSITAGGTLQKVFAANPGRKGCLITNDSTTPHAMYIYFGNGSTAPTVTANTGILLPGSTSGTTAPGNSFSCITPSGDVITDDVWIDGTTADKFGAVAW